MQTALRAAPLCKEAVARLSGGFLNAGRRFRVGPHQHFMCDAASGEPSANRSRLLDAFRTEPMIDGQCRQAAAALARPAIGKDRHGEAVGAAGYRNGDERMLLEAADRIERRGELSERQRRGRYIDHAVIARSGATKQSHWSERNPREIASLRSQ